MSANFVQVSSQAGRTQALAVGSTFQSFQFLPTGLKGQLPGGDYIYASRIRVRVTGTLHKTGAPIAPPNWQQLAQAFGQVRVYSPFLGEIVNKSHNSVPLLANHDQFFYNGFRPAVRKRPLIANIGTDADQAVEYEFEIPFERDDGVRSTDFCPWLPLLEGGIIEFDLAPSTAFNNYSASLAMTGNWTAEVVIDWFADKQALIHAPVANRLYKVTSQGPEYVLRAVGAPSGMDGVVQGCRLSKLSWLSKGDSASASFHDNGFYQAFAAGGGILFGTTGINRLDVPFRDQQSVNAVSAWIGSFLADTAPTRFRAVSNAAGTPDIDNDMSGWPYVMDGSRTANTTSYIQDALDFWPLVWNGRDAKIADMQKVDGDLTFSADLTTPPGAPVTHLFRTEEICAFTEAKAMDLMERMGLPHKARGGQFVYVPKYGGAKRADDTTQWGMPLKIVRAA